MDEGFTAGQAVRVSGVPYRTLDYWDRSGFLKPGVSSASGKGSDRRYSFRDLVSLKVAWELRRAGISLQALRRVLDNIPAITGAEAPFAEERLIVVGDDVAIVKGEGGLQSALKQPGQIYLAKIVLSLDQVIDQVREQVRDWAA